MAYSSWSVVFGEQPSAAKWNILGTNDAHFYSFLGDNTAWTSFVPTWTNVTIGNAVVTAKYIQIGKTIIGRVHCVFGTTSAVSGRITFSLPVTSVALDGAADLTAFGHAIYFDNGTGIYYGTIVHASTTTATTFAWAAGGTYLSQANTSSTVPFAWGSPPTSKVFSCTFVYQAA